MLTMGVKYFQRVSEILDKVISSQSVNIRKAAEVFACAVESGGSIYAFGCSHAGIIAEELFYRTGGMCVINPIFNPTLMLNTRPVTMTTRAERVEGFGREILERSPAKQGDVLLIHSVSGRNAVTVDMARAAREKGIYVIALTNLNYSTEVDSRHPSGMKLYEAVDLVIDNCGDFEDGAVELEGFEQKIGPTSTSIGTAIVNAVVVEASAILLEKDIQPPIYRSANVDGGDSFNKELVERYRDRIHYL